MKNFIIRIYDTHKETSFDLEKPVVELFVDTVPDNLDDLLKEHGGDYAVVNVIQH